MYDTTYICRSYVCLPVMQKKEQSQWMDRIIIINEKIDTLTVSLNSRQSLGFIWSFLCLLCAILLLIVPSIAHILRYVLWYFSPKHLPGFCSRHSPNRRMRVSSYHGYNQRMAGTWRLSTLGKKSGPSVQSSYTILLQILQRYGDTSDINKWHESWYCN